MTTNECRDLGCDYNAYRMGCRGDACRQARHDDYVKRRYGEGDDTDTGSVRIPTVDLVRAHVDDLGLDPGDAKAQMLSGLALVNAEILDSARASAKFHLVSQAQRAMLDALDRLDTHLKGNGGPADDGALQAFIESLSVPE